jgi:hypothetical protein
MEKRSIHQDFWAGVKGAPMVDLTSHNPVLDYWQLEVILRAAPIFGDHQVIVTRGHSSPLGQLALIRKFVVECGITQFPQVINEPWNEKISPFGDTVVYPWQEAWSELLHQYSLTGGKKGRKINPPLAAVCLFDYIVGTVNKKGTIISASPHIVPMPPEVDPKDKATPIDWSVWVDGMPRIGLMTRLSNDCLSANIGVKNITVEPANGCIHWDLFTPGKGGL